MSVSAPRQAPRWLQPAVDYGPLAIFFLVYLGAGLMAATAAVIAASLIGLALAWTLQRRVPLIPLITAAVVAIFGGLTLWLQDETFIKMKPTIVQALFAAILFGGLAVRPPAPEAPVRPHDAAVERCRLAPVHAPLRSLLRRDGGCSTRPSGAPSRPICG